MKKFILALALILTFTGSLLADTKLRDMTEITTPLSADLLYMVANPGSAPVDRKLTFGNLKINVNTSPNFIFGSDAEDDIPVRGSSTYGRLNVGAQTLVGRITGGHVAALNSSQVKTLLGYPTTSSDVIGFFTTCTTGYLKYDGTCESPVGTGTVTSSGTPTNHQWPGWTTDVNLKGFTVTASKPVCTDGSGDPGVCQGTEGVWQAALTRPVTGPSSPTTNGLVKFSGTGQEVDNAGLILGTLTNTYLCTYTTAGTLLDCNTNPATFATAGQTFYFGTTQVAINRTSDPLTVAGLTLTSPNFNFSSDAEDDIMVRGASAYGRLPITEQTVVGRLTGGHVAALSLGYEANNIPIMSASPGTPDGTKFLRDDGTWVLPPGMGDVSGPATNNDDYLPAWNGANSRELKDGYPISANGKTLINETFAQMLTSLGAQAALTYPVTGPASPTAGVPLCWDASGQVVKDCANLTDLAFSDYQTVLTNPVTGPASPSAGYLTKWDTSGDVLVDGPKLGTLTDAKWCTYTTADGLTCTEDAPAGAGDVTDVGNCSGGACYDGSSDGGTYVRLYDGTSDYVSILAGVRTLTLVPSIADSEDLVVTFGDNNNTVALGSTTGGVISVNGTPIPVSTTLQEALTNPVTGPASPSAGVPLCWDTSGQVAKDCTNLTDLAFSGYQTILSNPVTGPASPTAGLLTKWDTSGDVLADAFKYGTLTDAKWCTYTTADGLTCTEDAPGSASISDTAYNESTWDSVTTIAPSKNAIRDYLESKIPAGSDGSYGVLVLNNTSRTPTAASNELYPEGNIWKINQNGTESSMLLGPTAGQITFTGPTQARSYTLPDADSVSLAPLASPTFTGTVGLPAATVGAAEVKTVMKTEGATITIGNGTNAIATGVHLYTAFQVPFKCTLTKITLTTPNASTETITIDVWKGQLGATSGIAALTVSNSIFSTATKPALTADDHNVAVTSFDAGEDAVTAEDWFIVNVDAVSAMTIAQVAFTFTRAD